MELIDKEALISQIERNICKPCTDAGQDYNGARCRACKYGDEIDDIYNAPTVDAVPVVRCKDCIYFQQEQVRTSEGTYRNKFPNEGMVSIDVGINIGSHCKRVVDVRVEGFRDGEPTIERTHLWRNEDDFCSRGERKTDEQTN